MFVAQELSHAHQVSRKPTQESEPDNQPHTTFEEQLQELKDKLQKKYRTTFEDSFSEEVWAATYKDHNDRDINDTLFRVAAGAASVETTEALRLEWTEKFYDLLTSFKATAGGRIYANAGTEWGGTTLMNCYVGPRANYDPDSLDGILGHLRAQAHTLKSEGGWGENFSYIRPRGAFIHGIGVETPGAVKYMELFDKTSEIITSGSGRKSTHKKAKGKIRKGAMMGVLDVWHPDIVEFITAKQQSGRLTKFNISVNCTDEFMDKVVKLLKMQADGASQEDIAKDDVWNLRFPDTTFAKYKAEWDGNIKAWEVKGYPVKAYNTISVLWLWNLIMESTYNRAEPGVLFLDRANYFLPLNYAETVFATNPCGEQTLAPGGVCNLASLNLTQFVNEDRSGFDLKKVEKYTRIVVRFLDNINDLTKAPLPEYEVSIRKKRRIGVGILGWGSALYMLETKFASPEANKLRDEVMGTIARTSYMASIDLAEEKGMFEYCQPKWHVAGPFVKSLDLPAKYMEKLATTGIRNSSLLSIQPTGNTSILANVVSGGLEPVFMHDYIRTVIVGHMPEELADVTPKWFEGEWHETKMFKFAKEGDEEILKGKHTDGTTYKIDKNRGLTKEVLCEDYGVRYMKRLGEWDGRFAWTATAMSMNVEDHVNDLTGFARWVDSAMSKTVNVPHDYSFEDFKNIYLSAYKSQYVKGVTTYRTGTMTAVLSAKEEKHATCFDEEIILEDVRLPDSAPATMKILKAEGRKWYLTVIWNEQVTRPLAFFVHTNSHEKGITTTDAVDVLVKLARKKGIPRKHIDTAVDKMSVDNNPTKIARAISLNLRHGVLIKNIVAALDKVDGAHVGSFLFQIKKFLSSYIRDGDKVQDAICEGCGSSNIVYSEGCMKCADCGSSKCG
jgi:ribonucleoside-diphosphate reductase alpha chain